MEVERVLAEEAKERQALNAIINQPQNKSLNPEKIPDSEKGESRDKAASLVGNTNARYEGARLAGLVVLTTDTARKIIFRAHILIKIAHIVSFHIWLQGVYELLPKWKPLLKVHLLDEIGIQPLPVLPAWLQQFQH